MAGICKCRHKECEKSKECFRFNAPEEENTSDATFQCICTKSNGYKYFWKMELSLDQAEASVISEEE